MDATELTHVFPVHFMLSLSQANIIPQQDVFLQLMNLYGHTILPKCPCFTLGFMIDV